MAVISVAQGKERVLRVETQRNGLLYEVIARRYELNYIVKTDTYQTSQKEVVLDPRLPQVGSSYSQFSETDLPATCTHVEAKQGRESSYVWFVRCVFDTDRLIAQVTDNPLNQPPVISVDFTDYEKPLIRDNYGTPVKSSSGNAFDPPFMLDRRKAVFRIRRNEASSTADKAFQYNMTLNSVPFAVGSKQATPGFCRMNSITETTAIANGVFHYQVVYEIEYNPESFIVFLLDQDFRDIDGKQFRDKLTQEPLANPTPLNGRGKSLFLSTSTVDDAMGITATQTTMTIPGGDVVKFPPALMAAQSDGFIPGPYGNYQLRIGSEVVNVTGGHGTANLTIERGYAGTTPAIHAFGAAVSLEPYYLRFVPPPGPADWSPLNLPVIP